MLPVFNLFLTIQLCVYVAALQNYVLYSMHWNTLNDTMLLLANNDYYTEKKCVAKQSSNNSRLKRNYQLTGSIVTVHGRTYKIHLQMNIF